MQFSRENWFRAFSTFSGQIVGLVLFVTGLLKFVSFGRLLSSGEGLQLTNLAMFLVSVFELALSFWLLSRSSKYFAPVITLLFFFGTLAYGGYGG